MQPYDLHTHTQGKSSTDTSGWRLVVITTCLGEVAGELQMVQRQGVDSDHEESESESDVSSEEGGWGGGGLVE